MRTEPDYFYESLDRERDVAPSNRYFGSDSLALWGILPYLWGNQYGSPQITVAFSPSPAIVNATYFNATGIFESGPYASQLVAFQHPGGGAAGLPAIMRINHSGGDRGGADASDDGFDDTYQFTSDPAGLAAVVQAAQGIPGVVMFVRGAAVLVRDVSGTPVPVAAVVIVGPDGPVANTAVSTIIGPLTTDMLPNLPVNGIPSAGDSFDLVFFYTFTPIPTTINVPPPGGGLGIGRLKIAENNSPIPHDRVYFNYSFFSNVPITPDQDFDVRRYTPGFEKTFYDGLASIEMRFPFASTLDSDMVTGSMTTGRDTEFGNITTVFKALTYAVEPFASSVGLALSVPTAEDVTLSLPNGRRLVEIDNDAFHLQPFVGGLWAPNERLFAQGFAQLDFDLNGNEVSADPNGAGMQEVGTLSEATLLLLDASVGYWVYRELYTGRAITGVAPAVELHFDRSLEDGDVVQSGPFTIGDPTSELNVWNLTMGVHLELFGASKVSAAYTVPLSNESDRQFDGEVRVLCNIMPAPSQRRGGRLLCY